MDTATEKSLKTTLHRHAKALGIPDGASEVFVKRTLASVKKSLKEKSIITEKDLTRLVAKELQIYNQDLAYVYKNYDKII